SLLSRLPPISILIPYTTLFRSNEVFNKLLFSILGGVHLRHCPQLGVGGEDQVHRCRGPLQFAAGTVMTLIDAFRIIRLDPLGGQDRKSTRLNSSHVKISYAVFC